MNTDLLIINLNTYKIIIEKENLNIRVREIFLKYTFFFDNMENAKMQFEKKKNLFDSMEIVFPFAFNNLKIYSILSYLTKPKFILVK